MDIEARRRAAVDLLGALVLAMGIFVPVLLWWVGIL